MSDFWVPRTKRELVKWLTDHVNGSGFNKLTKKQLYAIYYRVRQGN